MKTKILGLAVFLVLVAASCYLMAALPTQPRVDIDAAVESDWDRYIEYSLDLIESDTVAVNMGGLDTLKIIHIESADSNTSGIYYPFEIFYEDTSGTDSTTTGSFGQHTDYLTIGSSIFKTDKFFLINPSTTETVTVEILLIGLSNR